MKRILIVVLSLCCMLYACVKPDKSVDISTEPVFTAEGLLNGVPISMAAGEHSMYMYTFAREEADGTFAYGGRIAKENCDQNCGPALEIFLIDTIPFVDQFGEIRVWDSLREVLFHGSVLNDPIRCQMDLTNNSYSAHGGLKESWQFNDGCIVEGKLNSDYLYFPSAGPVKTTLRVVDADSNYASIQKTLNYFDQNDSGFNLVANTTTQGRATISVEYPGYISGLSYKWDNGATSKSILVDVYSYLKDYTVTVTEPGGTETVLSCSVKGYGSSLSYVHANFNFDMADHQFNKSDAWPRVVVRYRDESGRWFDSRNIHQNDYCNYFALTNVQPYGTNYQGINTKKAEAFFTATLRDSAQQLVNLEHFKVTFGFGSRE